MSVRPHPKQETSPRFKDAWIIDYYDGQGKRRRITYYGTVVEARRVEHSWRIKTRGQILPTHPSLNQAALGYIEYYRLDHLQAGADRLVRSIKHLLRLVGRYQFPAITHATVKDYKKTRLAEGVKHTTINKELAALSGFCRWAEEQGFCRQVRIKRFPAKLTRPPMPNVPSRADMVKLLRAIPREKRGTFASMYYLGLRSQEARNLLPKHINWGQNIVLVTGKGNKQRVVPINRKVAPYLRHSLPFQAPKDLRLILYWAAKRGGLGRKFNPHLFRHAFGVHMTAAGVGIRPLQEMMGHSSPVVTERYTQVVAETLQKEMKKF